MLRRTSKSVKEAVYKMHLPAVVRLSRSFWGDARPETRSKLDFDLRQRTLGSKLDFVLKQLKTKSTIVWGGKTSPLVGHVVEMPNGNVVEMVDGQVFSCPPHHSYTSSLSLIH
jgi:hypothetical protein